MRKLFISTFIILFVLACAHMARMVEVPEVSHQVPKITGLDSKDSQKLLAQLTELESKSQDKASQWWLNYRKARIYDEIGDRQNACNSFFTLSGEAQFPLRELAHIHARKHCGEKMGDFVPSPNKEFEEKPWLKKIAQQSYQNYVTSLNPSREKVAHYEELIRLPLEREDKVRYIKELISLAEDFKLTQAELDDYDVLLYSLAPRLHPQPASYDEIFAAAADFRSHREFDPAIALYKKLLEDKNTELEQVYKAFINLRATYKVAGPEYLYLRTTDQMSEWAEKIYKEKATPQNRKIYYDTQLLLTRTVWTEGKSNQAISILKKVEEKLSGKHPLAEVFWLQARIREERQKEKQAIEWLDRGLNDSFKVTGNLKRSILWHKAWNLRKLKEYSKAAQSFEELISNTEDPYDLHRYRYWLGRTYKNLDDNQKATAQFETLTKEDNLGYYGMLAYRELARPIPSLNASRKLASQIQNGLKPEHKNYLDWLISLGEKEVALEYLEEISRKLTTNEKEDPLLWTELFAYYAKAGEFLPLFQQIGKIPAEFKDQFLNEYPQFLFPQPFSESVQEASLKAAVPKELIYAIMRQESAFNAKARSHADAFGLLQLLPRVADSVSKKHAIAYEKYEDLYEPHTNIMLGSHMIRDLLDKHKDQFVMSVASYNASEKAIRGWINTRLKDDPTAFIEDIPYEETRNYVKLVLRNFILYSRMNTTESSISFPEWCLENLHLFKS